MANQTITAPAGFRAAGVTCGIKPTGALDLGLLTADGPCAAAAVFTTNRYCGAPIVVGRAHVRGGRLQAVVVNSGVSNVATGERGVRDAQAMCRETGRRLGIDPHRVLPSSTGVIGHFLPMDKVRRGIALAVDALASTAPAGTAFARAIMTTDTHIKQACTRVRLGRTTITLAGCCKGSGMIAPNMATMLAYLTTDAAIAPAVLRRLLRTAAEHTFNRVTVDECQSTSDTVCVLASGQAANATIRTAGSRDAAAFAAALREVSEALAYAIAADGEGATRVLEVQVRGARTPADAHHVARTVAISPLVRTAVHGGDPNWGRVVQALGVTDATFDADRVRVQIGRHRVFEHGQPVRSASLKAVSKAMRGKHVVIAIDLHAGRCDDRVLTCDLTRDYIRINADYTT